MHVTFFLSMKYLTKSLIGSALTVGLCAGAVLADHRADATYAELQAMPQHQAAEHLLAAQGNINSAHLDVAFQTIFHPQRETVEYTPDLTEDLASAAQHIEEAETVLGNIGNLREDITTLQASEFDYRDFSTTAQDINASLAKEGIATVLGPEYVAKSWSHTKQSAAAKGLFLLGLLPLGYTIVTSYKGLRGRDGSSHIEHRQTSTGNVPRVTTVTQYSPERNWPRRLGQATLLAGSLGLIGLGAAATGVEEATDAYLENSPAYEAMLAFEQADKALENIDYRQRSSGSDKVVLTRQSKQELSDAKVAVHNLEPIYDPASDSYDVSMNIVAMDLDNLLTLEDGTEARYDELVATADDLVEHLHRKYSNAHPMAQKTKVVANAAQWGGFGLGALGLLGTGTWFFGSRSARRNRRGPRDLPEGYFD